MSDMTPTAVVQQSLDEAGIDYLLGDIEDGTRPSQVLLRAYRQCLMQLLRAAMWTFARKETDLVLLADSTGQTPNVGTQVLGNGFLYEYQYPIDSMRLRYIPANFISNPGAPPGNIVPPDPNAPIMPNLNQSPGLSHRIRPARYVIANDPNYPPPQGTIDWTVQGVSPQGRVVILTNVQNAKAVYTYLALYPSLWDALFREALVAYIAAKVVLPLSKDKKAGMEMRKAQMEIARDKVMTARAIDGNETWSSSSVKVNWLDTRYIGAGWWWGGMAGFEYGGAGSDFWGGADGGNVEGNSAY